MSVCSRSSEPPPTPAPRIRPTASISSMNRMQGAFSLAVLNMSRTRLAPTPTNIWMNSEPLMLKNGTPASPATARASSVLPVPGGPTSSTPLGTCGAEPLELLRVLEELDDLLQLALGVLHVGHVVEGDAHLALLVALGGALDVVAQEAAAERIAEARQEEQEEDAQQQHGRQQEAQHLPDPFGAVFLVEDLEALVVVAELGLGVHEHGIDGHGEFAVSRLRPDVLVVGVLELGDQVGVAAESDLGDLAGLDQLAELVEVDLAGAAGAHEEHHGQQDAGQDDEPDPVVGHDRERGACGGPRWAAWFDAAAWETPRVLPTPSPTASGGARSTSNPPARAAPLGASTPSRIPNEAAMTNDGASQERR